MSFKLLPSLLQFFQLLPSVLSVFFQRSGQLPKLLVHFFQTVIFRQFFLQHGLLSLDFFLTGFFPFFQLKCLLGLLQLPGIFVFLLFDFLQAFFRFLVFFCFDDAAVYFFQILLQFSHCLICLVLCCGILLAQSFQQLHNLCHGKLPVSGLFHLWHTVLVLITDYLADILLHAASGVLALPVHFFSLVLDFQLQSLVVPGLKQFPENFLPFHGICQKQLHKIPLCQHDDLGILPSVHPQDLPHSCIHFPFLRNDFPIWANQLYICQFFGDFISSLCRALVFGISFDLILFSPMGKGQLHLCGGIRRRIFGTEHGGLPVFPAGISVEGKCNGIKNGGFARPGISSYQIQPALSQTLHGKLHSSRIGSKR